MTTERSDRLDPLLRHDYVAQQHLLRYLFAGETLTPGSKTLDIACGTGFGTHILRQHGIDALGADIDRSQIAHAREMWGDHFDYADVLDLPFEDDTFDAVVSFETVEHVVEGARFMEEMRRVLKPRGVLVCSTPNIRYTSHPPYHLIEYTPADYFALVEGYFDEVVRYGQYFERSDRWRDLSQWYFWAYVKGVRNRIFGRPTPQPNTELPTQLDAATNPYRVQPYKGEAWLRIMVTVAR